MTPEELRKQFEKETNNTVAIYIHGFGMSERYALWLESRLLAAEQREREAFEAARKMIPAYSGPSGLKYPTYEDYSRLKERSEK